MDVLSRNGSSSSLRQLDAERTALVDTEQGTSYGAALKPHRRSKARRLAGYYLPGTYWIPNYSWSFFAGDFLAGVTVASMLIPQSVSYAFSLANMSPVTGLFSAIIPGVVYAFLGTSRQLNVAPEAALSLLLGQAVTEILHEFGESHGPAAESLGIAIASVITMQVGLFSFFLGLCRLGFIDVVLSRALLRGFVTALAIVITVEQLIPMFGLAALQRELHPTTTLSKIIFLVENAPNHLHKATTIISFATLAVLVALRYIKRYFKNTWWIYRMPEILIVVIVSTALSSKLGWDKLGVDILGSVPIKTGSSLIQAPFRADTIQFVRRTTSTAILISVVGFLDSIVAAKQNAARFGYSISPNRELVALGAANIVAAFVPGTLPAYGSITRSKMNADIGARTQMTAFVCSGTTLLATVFFLPWLYYLPKCVLAPIIGLVVLSLLSETPHDVVYYFKMRSWVDLTLMLLTFVFTIVWNVEAGVLISVVISLLVVVHRSSRTRMTILGRIPGTDRWKPINENPEALEDVPGVLIIRIRENLDFANTAQLKERLRRLELYGLDKSHPSDEPRREQASVLVFHLSDVDQCDASAVQIFYELCEEYRTRSVGLYITHIQDQPRQSFEKAGLFKLLGDHAVHDTVADAISHVETERL